MQTGLKLVPLRQSEDCLTVNVRAPVEAVGLPVMVWIHGGDHTDVSGSDILYRTNTLPALGCVLVTFNYRLGLFGFFAHPELADESPEGVSGNYGLLDQTAALVWVRDNISAFGGDPNRIAIFGESAGGQAVLNLMSSPAACGLFQAAIAQSPSDSGRWLLLRKPMFDFLPAEEAGQRFAESLVGAGSGQIARLRDLRGRDLNSAYKDQPHLGRHFYPCGGGCGLPELPLACFARSAEAPVPLIAGYNADEGSIFKTIFGPAGPEFEQIRMDTAELRTALARSYGDESHSERLLAAYPGLANQDAGAVAAHLGDHMFGCQVDHVTRTHAANGHPTFRYHFRALPASPTQTVGAFHGAELSYIFGFKTLLVPTREGHDALVADMANRWTSFASTREPNLGGLADWPDYDAGAPKHMVFDLPTSRVEDCPAQPGLDLMRERITHLTGLASETE
jgi:para-nitrobenzyl esterase